MKPVIEISGLDVRFGPHQAVNQLSLTVYENEVLALVGESGCGKSTTALAIMRLLPPSARISGDILFGQRNLTTLPLAAMREIRGNAISMIFQEPMTSLNPVLTIGYQIAETLRRHEALSRAAAARRAIELLELVAIPEPARRAHDYAHNLSGGQRQRVMIAMAIACRPRLLIADEPTTALDVTIQAQVLELLGTLRRELSMAVLLITHDLGVVGQYADRVAVMYDGQSVENGRTRDVFTRPGHPYTQGLLGASLSLDQNLHYREKRLPEIRVDRHGGTSGRTFTLSTGSRTAGANIAYTRRTTAQATGIPPDQIPLLEVSNLVTRYETSQRSFNAVDGVSFRIAQGETVGLVGESGCGKSTLSKTILKLIEPTSGTISFNGEDVTRVRGDALRAFRSRVQMIFQDPYASLNPRHSVYDTLDSTLVVHGIRNSRARRQRIKDVTDRVGLPVGALHRYAHEFSGGQRQRIGIARALVLEPQLIICDEPVSALDVSIRAQVLNLLVELKQSSGLSYLFISHDLSVVRYISDQVLVMNAGRIVDSGDHGTIWNRPGEPYTRSLIDAVPKPAFALAAHEETGATNYPLHLAR